MASTIIKQMVVNGGTTVTEIKTISSLLKTRAVAFAYGFMFGFVGLTIILSLRPSSNSSSGWFISVFGVTSAVISNGSYRSQFPPSIPHFMATPPLLSPYLGPGKTATASTERNFTNELVENWPNISSSIENAEPPMLVTDPTQMAPINQENGVAQKTVESNTSSFPWMTPCNPGKSRNDSKLGKIEIKGLTKLINCNLFDGEWVRDDTYPLYKPGSCSNIDGQFDCFVNGRPDREHEKYKWKPRGCSLPRLNAGHMLELLRGKRLVFVGDSLNRNMWESMVCILKSSMNDQSKVYEANGRTHLRQKASFSFIFEDYNCTVEFFASPFLVQEWEVPDENGSLKETLRLDLVSRSSNEYKSADVIVFNTGHWWTHEKTSRGKDYYQEGSHVYDELNVIEAFRRALTTWSRWIDANINPAKSLIFFRGYSASHFSGGQWNSGGGCDNEIEPIKNDKYIRRYPAKMTVLENVMKWMKTHVVYLNITEMTDYRKDGHPSIYRKREISEEERRKPEQFQDCSHWCLPGVPDAWNEILYAELLINENQKNKQTKIKHPRRGLLRGLRSV